MNRTQTALKRRTTLTLPSESLLAAQKIARSRHVNLSTVISEVVSAGLQLETARQRRSQVLDNYRKAFTGFTEDEVAILDGVMLAPVAGKRRPRPSLPK